ncbi:hypothetical protein JTB14_014684 [Gonioctena quinquepunctata]|nr:hypothetical protein JTB14_014684 [Gonioctena quinquepunctata]
MSSRRNRIKVIANLNVRRKNVADENQVKSEKISDRENTESIEFNHHEQTPINQEKTANEEDSISSGTAKNTLVEVAETKIKENSTHEYSDKNQSPLPETICRNSILNNDKQATDTLLTGKARIPLRRKLIKIPVSVNVLNRKSKEKSPSRVNDQQDTIFAENEVTLDETILVPRNCIPDPEDTNESASDKLSAKPIQLTGNVISDIDYPPPPPSPNKMNRSRIKAIPRFGYRKASFSASESEDESRKHNRIRNDSVCSTTSAIAESITECLSPQKQREITSIVPKKCNRSEQTRKLAEARREFQRRFGSEKPDRQKLTMMDLLFYNPKSNPMIDGEKEKQENAKKEDKVDDNINESEIVDDPQPEEDTADKSDEENAVPVPQIKIGPSGEIILDEKSLVIESKEVKRQREEMQKTDVVNGDFDTGYGVYKKHKRSKTWSHEETVRFYKALNTIGTDFTLMTELFSNRSRRDLKMKFKKEERINGNLLNKAVMCPGSFEFDELEMRP